MKLKEDQFKNQKNTLRVSGSESGLISVVPPCRGLVLFLHHSCVGLVLLLWVIPVWGWSYFCGPFLCGAGLTSVGHMSVGHSYVGLVLLLWVIPMCV